MGEIKYRSESEMKDSGVEWVKRIPKEWNVIKIGKLGQINTSSVNKKIEKGEKIINLLNYLDIYRNPSKKISSKIDYMRVSANEHQRISSQIHLGDVIFTPSSETSDDIGHSAVVVENLDNTLFSYHVVRLSFNKYVDLNYKKYLFNNHITMNQFSKKATGTTRKTLDKDDFRYSYVFLPTNNEQINIANFLHIKTTELDQVISKKENLIEKLEEAKKSLISEVVTGKVKIVDGKLIPRNDSEMMYSGVEWLGMIPRDWDIIKIKFISKLNKETIENNTRKDTKINYIDIGSVDSNGNIKETQKYNFNDAPSRARRIVSKGDVIISTVRTYLKSIAYINKSYDKYICSTGFAVISPNKEFLISEYFYYVIQSSKYVDQIVSKSVGVSYPAINGSEIIDLKFALPNIYEQEYMMEFLKNKINTLNLYINNNNIQIQKLTQAKKSLISEAVTGKIDLRDWEIKEEGEVQ